jgi:hypothetical protein
MEIMSKDHLRPSDCISAAGAAHGIEPCVTHQAKLAAYHRALEMAAVRLEILTGRMRACREETGQHDLIDEAEAFCLEARADLKKLAAPASAASATTRSRRRRERNVRTA